MAKAKQQGAFGIREIILITYVSICVVMVVLALFVSFTNLDVHDRQISQPAASSTDYTATPNPLVLTLQAEDYEPVSTAPAEARP